MHMHLNRSESWNLAHVRLSRNAHKKTSSSPTRTSSTQFFFHFSINTGYTSRLSFANSNCLYNRHDSSPRMDAAAIQRRCTPRCAIIERRESSKPSHCAEFHFPEQYWGSSEGGRCYFKYYPPARSDSAAQRASDQSETICYAQGIRTQHSWLDDTWQWSERNTSSTVYCKPAAEGNPDRCQPGIRKWGYLSARQCSTVTVDANLPVRSW